jgi:hypothetical protein
MKTKQVASGSTVTYVVVLDEGEEAFSALSGWAVDHDISAAQVTAVGAFGRATVGWFDPGSQGLLAHRDRPAVRGAFPHRGHRARPRRSGRSQPHLHAVLGLADGSTRGRAPARRPRLADARGHHPRDPGRTPQNAPPRRRPSAHRPRPGLTSGHSCSLAPRLALPTQASPKMAQSRRGVRPPWPPVVAVAHAAASRSRPALPGLAPPVSSRPRCPPSHWFAARTPGTGAGPGSRRRFAAPDRSAVQPSRPMRLGRTVRDPRSRTHLPRAIRRKHTQSWCRPLSIPPPIRPAPTLDRCPRQPRLCRRFPPGSNASTVSKLMR